MAKYLKSLYSIYHRKKFDKNELKWRKEGRKD